LSVLVVDDNKTNRETLEEWLRGWQMEPVARGDGMGALDAMRNSAASGRPFPLVLLDGRMPDTDSLSLASAISERAQPATTRIILLSSGDCSEDVPRLSHLRIDARLPKPVQQDELLATIYRVMLSPEGDREGRAPPALPAAKIDHPSGIESLRILVAEDNEFNAQLIEQLGTRRGHRVTLARDGREALALAQRETFDLLLLDIQMPDLDGFHVVQTIRAKERTSGGHLPVIALTASARQAERERCLASGMDEFLSKPIRSGELWAAIDRVVVARPPSKVQARGLLDPVVLWDVCGGDPGILEKLCQSFRSRVPEAIAIVRDAWRARDASRLRESAHKLSGLLAAFSSIAGGVASDLEDHAARGRLDEAGPMVANLESMVQELTQLTSRLSHETLRHQAKTPDDSSRNAST
jgi:CheY-like chemotaxis protein